MADPLEPVWAAMEAVDPTLMPDGWRRLEPSVREALVTAGIFVRGDPVERVRCPVCTPSHFEPVIARTGKDGTIEHFIKCPREMRVRVHPDDLQTWRVDVAAVARSIAETAALVGDVRPLGSDRSWFCGHVVVRGVRVEVVLARGIGRADGAGVAASIPRSPLQRLVLVPSSVPDESLWGDRATSVLSLRGLATIQDGVLAVEQRAIFLAAQHILRGGELPPHLFTLKGDFWAIGFDGGEVTHLKDSAGLVYLARLLSEPHRALPAVTLLAARAGIDERVTLGSAGSAADERLRAEMRERYRDLMSQRDAADRTNDIGRLAAIDTELDELMVETNRRFGLGGRARESSDADNIRKAVFMAIDRSIEAIAGPLPDLGRHLRSHIRTGRVCRYAPDREIEWVI